MDESAANLMARKWERARRALTELTMSPRILVGQDVGPEEYDPRVECILALEDIAGSVPEKYSAAFAYSLLRVVGHLFQGDTENLHLELSELLGVVMVGWRVAMVEAARRSEVRLSNLIEEITAIRAEEGSMSTTPPVDGPPDF